MIIFDFKAYDCETIGRTGFDSSMLTRREREQYTYVRGLAYALVEWLDHHYTIQVETGPSNLPGMSHSWSFNDILFAVGQFLGDVVCYQQRAKSAQIDGAPGCSPDALEDYIRDTFSVNGIPNSVYRGYHVRTKEIDVAGDENHCITYGPIFTGKWHAKKRSRVETYVAKGINFSSS